MMRADTNYILLYVQEEPSSIFLSFCLYLLMRSHKKREEGNVTAIHWLYQLWSFKDCWLNFFHHYACVFRSNRLSKYVKTFFEMDHQECMNHRVTCDLKKENK